MSNFKVGDKAVALFSHQTSFFTSVRKDNEYIVTNVQYCSRCGKQWVNVDSQTTHQTHNNMMECAQPCDTDNPHRGYAWSMASCFAKPLSNKYRMEVSIPELTEIKTYQVQ